MKIQTKRREAEKQKHGSLQGSGQIIEKLLGILKEEGNNFNHKIWIALILQLLKLCELTIQEPLFSRTQKKNRQNQNHNQKKQKQKNRTNPLEIHSKTSTSLTLSLSLSLCGIPHETRMLHTQQTFSATESPPCFLPLLVPPFPHSLHTELYLVSCDPIKLWSFWGCRSCGINTQSNDINAQKLQRDMMNLMSNGKIPKLSCFWAKFYLILTSVYLCSLSLSSYRITAPTICSPFSTIYELLSPTSLKSTPFTPSFFLWFSFLFLFKILFSFSIKLLTI